MTLPEPMSTTEARSQALRAFADIARALGNEHRLELLNFLAQGERCVDRLAELSGQSMANVSQHLQVMRRVGVVQSRRDGKHVRYRLADPSVLELIVALQTFGERSSDQIRVLGIEYFTRRDDRSTLTPEELLDELTTGDVVVIDVRPCDEYELGHVPGALSVPLSTLEPQLDEFPPSRLTVAYGRGPFCVASFEAVATLRDHGRDVQRFRGGVPYWKAAGLPLETGS